MPEPKRILLVEDDRISQKIYRNHISATHPDVPVDAVRTLIAAADLLKNNAYSAIVLDNMFPATEPSPHFDDDMKRVAGYGMRSGQNNGIEMIWALRKGAHFPLNKQCPIYFHSTTMDEELSGSAKRAGATVCADKGAIETDGIDAFLKEHLGLSEGQRRY